MAIFILSKRKVIEQYNKLKEIADTVGYNYKTNPLVGKIIEQSTDAPISVSSLNDAMEIGQKERINYIVQGETLDEIKLLRKSGVKTFIVDNENDLQKVLSLKEPTSLFIRMKVREHTIYTGKYFVYGINWMKLPKLIEKISKNKNIESLGIHFHRKTQNVGEWMLVEEFSDILTKEIAHNLDTIIIGGGIPIRYANSNPDITSIFRKISEFRKFVNSFGLKFAVEPGRYIAAPAVKLETKIINAYERNLILDCSIYNAYMDTFLIHTRLPVEGETDHGYKYLLKGKSPDSLDIFRYRVFFPEEKKIGDKITFLNAGAYNFYTEFNNMPKIKTLIVD